jgi:hypothetical protein
VGTGSAADEPDRRRRRRRPESGRGSESRSGASGSSGESRSDADSSTSGTERRRSSRESRQRGGESGGHTSRRRDRREATDARSSGYSRGRRSDFAPVAGSRDDDDEGLEFLGLEEAGREPRRRELHAEDDDVIVESGLSTVLDVPSWVEAIGIVIAGNLDARSRSGRGEGRSR